MCATKFDIEEKELAFIQDYAKTDGIAALQEEAKVQQSSSVKFWLNLVFFDDSSVY